MKLKYLYLGLLSTLVLANQAEAMMKRTYEAPVTQQKLKQHEDLQAKIEPMLDIGTHGNQEAAAQHISDEIGKHPVKANRSGKTVNHRITDVNTRLGTKAAGPTGPSAHEKLTDLMVIQGAVTNQRIAGGVGTGNVGLGAGDLAGTAIKNEEAILARLKTAIAANVAAGVALEGQVATKTTGTGAGALVAGDTNAAGLATNIHDFLAELGW